MAKKQKPKQNAKSDSSPSSRELKKSDAWFWAFIVALIVIAGLVYYYPGQFPFEKTRDKGTVMLEKGNSETMEIKYYATYLQFINHLQANLPEQDVFIENPDNNDEVIRLEAEDIEDEDILDEMLFTTETPTEHDPFKLGENPLGPFEKGDAFDFTLEDWLSATGTGIYSINGNEAELKLSFENLVPDGVYTVWCSRITFPPDVKVVDAPCGNPDGSDNKFTADSDGDADITVEIDPLEPSTKETVNVIALAYHSDGKTYGESPGEFGSKSHVHIFAIINPPGKPTSGWTLHVDAKKHFPGNEDMIAHHYCKTVSGGIWECQLYDSDGDDARLVGVEVIVPTEVWEEFSDEEQALWHYHKEEIPKVEAILPETPPADVAKVVQSLEETYGKLYILWDPAEQDLPIGEPSLTVLE